MDIKTAVQAIGMKCTLKGRDGWEIKDLQIEDAKQSFGRVRLEVVQRGRADGFGKVEWVAASRVEIVR